MIVQRQQTVDKDIISSVSCKRQVKLNVVLIILIINNQLLNLTNILLTHPVYYSPLLKLLYESCIYDIVYCMVLLLVEGWNKMKKHYVNINRGLQ